jgi:DNA repair protein RadC
MRARMIAPGGCFARHELLEMTLFGLIPRRDTNALAHRLLFTFGGLRGLLDADVAAIAAVEGMTVNAAVGLKVIARLSSALDAESELPLHILANYGDLAKHARRLFCNPARVCAAILLSGENAIVGTVLFTDADGIGSAVLNAVVRLRAARVVLCYRGDDIDPRDPTTTLRTAGITVQDVLHVYADAVVSTRLNAALTADETERLAADPDGDYFE